MGNLLLWIVGTLVAAGIGVVATVAFEEPLKWCIDRITRRAGTRPIPILGVWEATFSIVEDGKRREYSEIIELRLRYFSIEGFVVPNSRSQPGLAVARHLWPLRVRGEFVDGQFFTGEWFHPIKSARFRGAFQLVLNPRGRIMAGKWIGFSETFNEISSGDWQWKKSKDLSVNIDKWDFRTEVTLQE